MLKVSREASLGRSHGAWHAVSQIKLAGQDDSTRQTCMNVATGREDFQLDRQAQESESTNISCVSVRCSAM